MKKKAHIFSLLMLLALTPLQQGCVVAGAAVVGAGGIYYAKGHLTKTLDASVDETYAATIKALKALDIVVYKDEFSSRLAHVRAKYISTGKNVNIVIEYDTMIATKISIQVGMFGDREQSTAILTAIERNL